MWFVLAQLAKGHVYFCPHLASVIICTLVCKFGSYNLRPYGPSGLSFWSVIFCIGWEKRGVLNYNQELVMIFKMHETSHCDMKSSNFKQWMSQELWCPNPTDAANEKCIKSSIETPMKV